MVRQMNQLEALKVIEKSRNEFVSQVDQAAEAAIIEVIKDHYPEHSILAEESGAAGDHEYQWIIDPLDGTTNFIHGFPTFAVSIALAYRNQVQQAVASLPSRVPFERARRTTGFHFVDHLLRQQLLSLGAAQQFELRNMLRGISYRRFE